MSVCFSENIVNLPHTVSHLNLSQFILNAYAHCMVKAVGERSTAAYHQWPE